MSPSDGELIGMWLQRNERWAILLESARQEQISKFGRKIGPVHWIGSPDLGPWTWLGFFWEKERLWFGYGFDGRDFRLMIEADASQPCARAWVLLKKQLPKVWNYSRHGRYLRLFADPDVTLVPRAQMAWLRERSLELHEFVVGG